MSVHTLPVLSLTALSALEAYGALSRFDDRVKGFKEAKDRAQATGRTLVVIGDPDGGAHTRLLRAYDCGDVCLDLSGCPQCPLAYAVDITKGPIQQIQNNSAVVFVSCVLEYVSDFDAAWKEIMRMAGTTDNVFVVEVQPWTITSLLYPGAKRTLKPVSIPGSSRPTYEQTPVSGAWKIGIVALLGALATLALWPSPKPKEEQT